MGYLLIAALLISAATSWRSPRGDSRFLARAALGLACMIAIQMWWYQ